jgi:hypothetical protein
MRFDKFFLEHEGTGRYYVRGEDGWRVGEIIGAAGNWAAWYRGEQTYGFKTKRAAASYLLKCKEGESH